MILIAGSFYEVSLIIYVMCCVHNEGMSSSFPCSCLVFLDRESVVGREQNDIRLSLKHVCMCVKNSFGGQRSGTGTKFGLHLFCEIKVV